MMITSYLTAYDKTNFYLLEIGDIASCEGRWKSQETEKRTVHRGRSMTGELTADGRIKKKWEMGIRNPCDEN
jgi:hypothetical protein